MAWIVLSILLFIFAWIGIFAWMWAKKAKEKTADPADPYSSDPPEWAIWGGVSTAIACVVIWVFMTGLFMVKTVGEREVGIVYNFTNTIAGKREKGWVTIAPWQHMEKANVAIQHAEFVFGQDNSAVSKDQQDIFANLGVNFRLDAAEVLDLYSRVGPNWREIIVEDRIPQVFKEVTSTFNTPEITERRAALRQQTREGLAAELSQYDIEVVDVFITNLGFSALYSQAIEEKQKQVQDALQAEAKVKQVEAEARQKVAEARGEANANIARAAGDARANRLRQRSLTPRLIQWEAIQKLNPDVQMIICPPQSVCIPNSGAFPVPNGTP